MACAVAAQLAGPEALPELNTGATLERLQREKDELQRRCAPAGSANVAVEHRVSVKKCMSCSRSEAPWLSSGSPCGQSEQASHFLFSLHHSLRLSNVSNQALCSAICRTLLHGSARQSGVDSMRLDSIGENLHSLAK